MGLVDIYWMGSQRVTHNTGLSMQVNHDAEEDTWWRVRYCLIMYLKFSTQWNGWPNITGLG